MENPSVKRKRLLASQTIHPSPSCCECFFYEVIEGEDMLWCKRHEIYVYAEEHCSDFEWEEN